MSEIPFLVPGDTCVFYPGGDRTVEPRAAIVTGPWPPTKNGIVNLSLVKIPAVNLEPIRGVRHIDDPYIETHPASVKGDGRGAWATVASVREQAVKIIAYKEDQRKRKTVVGTKHLQEASTA